MSIEQDLARHVAGLRPDEAARSAARRLLLDTLAAVVSGAANPGCEAAVHTLLGAEVGAAPVPGRPEGASPARAALATGILAHWCEWDDVHDAAGIHGAAVIFPALIGLLGHPMASTANGDDLLDAAVAAYDVAALIGREMNAGSFHGWMTTGAAGAIGAAAGGARLLGLDAAGILSAMGIAAAGGGLSRQALVDRTTGKSILCGLAAQNAVQAVELAAAGINGAPNFLAGPFGLAMLHAGTALDFDAAFAAIAPAAAIAEAGTKPWPCCRSTHPSIDAIMAFRAERPDAAETVRAMNFTVPALPFALCGRPFEPGDDPRVAAQFSIAFTTVLALRNGRILPEDFSPEAVMRFAAGNAALIGAVSVAQAQRRVRHRQETIPSFAVLHLADGTSWEHRVDAIRGGAERPLCDSELADKLSNAAGARIAAAAVDRLHEAVASLGGNDTHTLRAAITHLADRNEPDSPPARASAAS